MKSPTLLPTAAGLFHDRRSFLKRLSESTVLFAVPGAFADELMRTPRQTEGPFYPDHLPLDTDNDLILINDSLTPAVGESANVGVPSRAPAGEPIRSAVVEIWEADTHGIYIHSRSGGDKSQEDKNFQ